MLKYSILKIRSKICSSALLANFKFKLWPVHARKKKTKNNYSPLVSSSQISYMTTKSCSDLTCEVLSKFKYIYIKSRQIIYTN
jgi:hypothetical protein